MNSSRKVVITGIGLATPLGCHASTVWKKLLNGESGIKSLVGSEYKNIPSKVAGFVSDGTSENEFNAKLYSSSSTTRAISFALHCAETALKDAEILSYSKLDKSRIGVSVGTGMIDLSFVQETGENLKTKGYKRVSPFFVPKILPNLAAGHISIKYGFTGPSMCISTACTTGVHAIGDAFRMINYGDADIMVAGATEACIGPLSVAGFARARALSTKYNENPNLASRPFDEERDGFVISEGSTLLILEEENYARNRKAKIYGNILGYGMSSDAEHITNPSENGEGAYLSMKNALEDAKISPADVGYINAHATSTPAGDLAEVKAIQNLFQNCDNLKVSSTKGAVGHLLGAAGAVETAFTLLACYHAQIPPTINLNNLSRGMNLNFATEDTGNVWDSRKRYALSNSFGFGGTNASICVCNTQD